MSIHPEHSQNEQVTASESAHVNINRFTLPVSGRELLIAIICAVAILTSLTLWSKLHDADKDIQTQIWLRSDSLTKENAELRAQILATQAMVQAYGMSKACKEKT